MDAWTIILSIFGAVLGSNGLWAYLQYRRDKKDEERKKREAEESAETKMLLGLGHDRIVYLCMKYIERGWISSDEHEDLMKYLYEPYLKLKGNGTAERLVKEINKLPIHNLTYVQQARQNNGQPDDNPPA